MVTGDNLQGRSERRQVLLAFSYAFSTTGAYVIGRSVADALFLARVGASWLPVMYLISACGVGLLAIGFLHFSNRRSLQQIILTILPLLAAVSLALCQLIQHFDHAILFLAGLYLLAEIRGSLNAIQYGILMNELFAGSPNHRHVAGLLGAAATLAGILFGAGVALEVHQLGTVQLLYVVAGLDFLSMIPIALLSTGVSDETNRRPLLPTKAIAALGVDYEAVEVSTGVVRAAKSSYVRSIATLVSLSVVVGTLIEYQWKTSVGVSFATNEDRMTGFFGLFYAATDLITGVFQLLLTGKILNHFGTWNALLVFPAALFATTAGVLITSFDRVNLWAITLSKGCNVFKRGTNDPATWMLYAPLSDGPRRQAITLVSGVVKPIAEAAAAVLIILLSGFYGTRTFSYLALSLILVWLFLAHIYRRNRLAPGPVRNSAPEACIPNA